MQDVQTLAGNYVAVWNEPEAGRRREAMAALWAPSAEHYTPTREVHGYPELEQRITGAYEKNVRDGGNQFRAVQDARAVRDVVTFGWEMLPVCGEDVSARGRIVLLLDHQGRIRADYQFTL